MKIKTFLDNFFFSPASPKPLGALRIGISLVLLLQAWTMYGSFLNFFSRDGILEDQLNSLLSDPQLPKWEWITPYLGHWGIGESSFLTFVGGLYVLSLISLLVGYYTRASSILVWLLHWTFLNSGYSGSYGADMYAHIFLFYLMLVPCGSAYSLDGYLGRVGMGASWQARLGLRVMQLHLCISYLVSGIEKSTGPQWWNGEILWRALTHPIYEVLDFTWLAQYPYLPMMGGWATLAIETFYCIFIWHKKTRPLWVFATCMLHLGIAVFLSLPIFGLLMCVFTLGLFGVSSKEESKEESYSSARA